MNGKMKIFSLLMILGGIFWFKSPAGWCPPCHSGTYPNCIPICTGEQICCNGTCCSGSCCGGTCCPSGRSCCDGTCCDSGENCCDGSCCLEGNICCNGNCITPCDPDDCESCKDGSCVICNDDPDQACCNGTCYDINTKKCCGDTDDDYICGINEGCCGGTCYDINTQKCCSDTILGSKYVCGINETCCKGQCCAVGQACCDTSFTGGTCYNTTTQKCCPGVPGYNGGYDYICDSNECCDPDGGCLDKCNMENPCVFAMPPDPEWPDCTNTGDTRECQPGVEGKICNYHVSYHPNSANCAVCEPNCDKHHVGPCAIITPIKCKNLYIPPFTFICQCDDWDDEYESGNYYECGLAPE